MLVDFQVQNFRSIREPVLLSMVEQAPGKPKQKGSDRKRPMPTDEEISPALDALGRKFKLLRTAGIFGANASGKSNVVKALALLCDLLKYGPDPQNIAPRMVPFADGSGSPTHFHLRILAPLVNGTYLYTYELSLTKERVVSERLAVDLGDSQVEIFSRRPGGNAPSFDAGLPALVVESEKVLAAGTPLLHVLLRTLNLPWLVGLSLWLFQTNCYTEADYWLAGFDTRKMIEKDEVFRKSVAELVHSFDTGITGLSVEATERSPRVLASHADLPGAPVWALEEESAGTQRLFDVSGPALKALLSGGLVVLDEFGAHLHPHITRRIVELFQHPATNPHGAQLIFNSQDVTLLSNHLLRRDQIWYTAKTAGGCTELFPLSDFKVRNDLAIDQAYLDGRFGAVPFLPSSGGM